MTVRTTKQDERMSPRQVATPDMFPIDGIHRHLPPPPPPSCAGCLRKDALLAQTTQRVAKLHSGSPDVETLQALSHAELSQILVDLLGALSQSTSLLPPPTPASSGSNGAAAPADEELIYFYRPGEHSADYLNPNPDSPRPSSLLTLHPITHTDDRNDRNVDTVAELGAKDGHPLQLNGISTPSGAQTTTSWLTMPPFEAQHHQQDFLHPYLMGDVFTSSGTTIASEPGRPDAKMQTQSEFAVDTQGFDTVNEYCILDTIGKGASAKVMLAIDTKTDEARAIKIIPRLNVVERLSRTSTAVSALEEVATMKKLRHKNIIQLFECIDDPAEDCLYLVMQYAARGAVSQVEPDGSCLPLSITTVASYAKQIVSALRYMHAHGITHRDIKPENILCDDEGNAYLADFGISSFTGADTESFAGSPYFVAPEVLQNGATSGPASDAWALGVTLYALLFGKLPFFADTYVEAIQVILHSAVTFPPASPDKVKWQVVLRQLLDKDPATRMTLRELSRHPLLNGSTPQHSSDTPSGDDEIDEIHPTLQDCIHAITSRSCGALHRERDSLSHTGRSPAVSPVTTTFCHVRPISQSGCTTESNTPLLSRGLTSAHF